MSMPSQKHRKGQIYFASIIVGMCGIPAEIKSVTKQDKLSY